MNSRFPDSLFQNVSRPGRYAGGEWNSVTKDWDTASLRIALCYPDVYELGMSNLAVPVLYDILNRQPDVIAERVFTPWTDMEGLLRGNAQRLFSLETRHPLSDFDIVGFSLGSELTFTNVLTVLDLGGIPLLREERSARHPLVIAGGSCAVNPEPLSDFIDLFFIGEAEEGILELLDVYRTHSGVREQFLRSAARLHGSYVPSLYAARYHADGSFQAIEPLASEAPAIVSRRIVPVLPPPPTHPVVPFLEATHDYASVEIQRGCTRGCRFCQAGMIDRPSRTRSRAQILEACEQLADNCGYGELSLLSLSSSDYPEIEDLVSDLEPLCQRRNLSLSLPSLRLGPQSVRLLEAAPGKRSSSFTFAPEAGTERLRRAINKNVTEEDIFSTLQAVIQGGWTKLKLYFMMGFPTETEEDIEGITDLVRRILRSGPRLGVNVGVNLLIPKPHTPLQWAPQDDEKLVRAKVDLLKSGLKRGSVKLTWPDSHVSQVEAALSRGDRRIGKVILRAWQLGSRFDAWGEGFCYENWRMAFESCGFRIEDFANRERALDEPLPWAHIDAGVSQAFLKREYGRMLSGTPTEDCRTEDCNACGLHAREDGCAERLRAGKATVS
ncbi:MAG: TIGR03960 family B12-binding radical SAM protein [Dehalococcoidia bacterium]|nr:TIGR03960 family B12-binding radical SAM protein [Dehalococcoidia bacterium]